MEQGAGWTEAAIDRLCTKLAAMGLVGWAEWQAKHVDDVAALVGATPAQQKKILKTATEPELLRFGAVAASLEALLLIRAAAELEDYVGTSYRGLLSHAIRAVGEVRDAEPLFDPAPYRVYGDTEFWYRALSALAGSCQNSAI
ncbi:hypothetical protein [Caenispirillum bisanense]|uniref:hypothetical protein n=1 Tax=Caenispirillum bisanense TaxID=414052 RepID=UPI001141A292|nr:hypothetical protein [Caenispirillum bisanense]